RQPWPAGSSPGANHHQWPGRRSTDSLTDVAAPSRAATNVSRPPQERAWRRYRRMRTLLDLQIARDLRKDSGLSEADYDMLSTLSEKPEGCWRAQDLAAQLLWSTSRLAYHVGRMEQCGLVARQPCADDARGALISLTQQGQTTLHQAAPPHVGSVPRHMIHPL